MLDKDTKSLLEAVNKIINPIDEISDEKLKSYLDKSMTSKPERWKGEKGEKTGKAWVKAADKVEKKAVNETSLWVDANSSDDTLFVVEAFTDDMLEEGSGSLGGLPKHIIKTITKGYSSSGAGHGGENSPVTEHGRVTSYSKFHHHLGNAMKDHNAVHVVYHNGRPIGSTHTKWVSSGTRAEHGVTDDTGEKYVKRPMRDLHGARKYLSAEDRKYDDPKHNKAEAINQVIHHVVKKHIGDDDITDKDTYKKHHIEVKSYHPDPERKAKKAAREKGSEDSDSLKKNREKAIDKMAYKHVVGNSPHSKAKELHKKIGDAIESGDHGAARTHMRELDDHIRHSGIAKDSYDKESYKKAIHNLARGTRSASTDSWSGDYDKKRGREDLEHLKKRGAIKEHIEFSEAELAYMAEILDAADAQELEELSKKTLKSYIDKAGISAHQYNLKASNAKDKETEGLMGRKVIYRDKSKRLAMAKLEPRPWHKDVKVMAKEDVESLDVKRGRPPKSASTSDEPRQHVIQQLQRAKLSLTGGSKVKFKDGTEHHISGTHASKVLDKYMSLKPSEKEAFQTKVGQSHEHLKSEL